MPPSKLPIRTVTLIKQRWNKLNAFQQGLATLILLVLGVYFWHIIAVNNYAWDGTGTVSLFPSDDQSKNYRVDADISAVEHTLPFVKGHDTYIVNSVTWPDGGSTKLIGCIIQSNIGYATCISDNGSNYRVEVTTPPPLPDGSDISND